ncbi:MAG: hypothetical protein H6832_14980 [Planctomycetes bacterium]|nr:hypothetical protein [Planctomycetota bacterium]
MSVEDFDLLFTHAQFGKHPLRLLASFLRRGNYGWRDDLADATRRRGRLAPSKTERSA